MSERCFLSLLIINSGWNKKIQLFGYPWFAKEENGKEMESNIHDVCPRETGLQFKTIRNGRWTHEVVPYGYILDILFIHFSSFSVFFFFLIFPFCMTRMARTLARMTRMARTCGRPNIKFPSLGWKFVKSVFPQGWEDCQTLGWWDSGSTIHNVQPTFKPGF